MGDRIHEGAYRLAWSDEFDGAPGSLADEATWQAEIGGSGWGNQELQAARVRRVNGHLHLAPRHAGGLQADFIRNVTP